MCLSAQPHVIVPGTKTIQTEHGVVFTRYKVERMGLVESKDRFGLAVVFDKVVEQTLTVWQISPVTLLTRFGGIIGVGKNLLWIMIFLCSSFLAIFKSVHRRVF